MFNVTQRVKEIKQPRGGYIKPAEFITISLGGGLDELMTESENIHASIIGLTVDYLTRYFVFGNKRNAFHVSLMGVHCAYEDGIVNALDEGFALFDKIEMTLSDEVITAACKLTTFDVWYRCPSRAAQSKSASATDPNKETIDDIRTMVLRSIDFFAKYGPVTCDGFTFEPDGLSSIYEDWKWRGIGNFGGYTRTISGGDGDFLTKDTLWDFKVSKSKITSSHTLQLIIYYVMGKHSKQHKFDDIHNIGIFNPRRNEVYLYDVNKLDERILEIIETDVVCYENREWSETPEHINTISVG